MRLSPRPASAGIIAGSESKAAELSMRFFGTSKIDVDVERHLRSLGNLNGKVVVDLPAGAGRMSRVLQELGATVEPYDLFPEFFHVEGLVCRQADLNADLPIADNHADYVLFQEGIEHLPDQLNALREMNRILKPGGRLLLTTPNISNLRARIAYLLLESDLHNKLPRNELDSVSYSSADAQRIYFGHLFLIGVQRLRALATVVGLRLVSIHSSKLSLGSLALIFLYPLMVLATVLAYRSSARLKHVRTRHERAVIQEHFSQIARLNLHPQVLFGKKLFLEFEKVAEGDTAGWAKLKV
jgi:SAM-dependent methyltransferase